FSSATNTAAAKVSTNSPDFRDRVARRPREMWDIALLLNATKPRLQTLGTGLVFKPGKYLVYRNDLGGAQEADAKEFLRDVTDRVAPLVAQFMDKLLALKVDLPKPDPAAMATATPGQPQPPPAP